MGATSGLIRSHVKVVKVVKVVLSALRVKHHASRFSSDLRCRSFLLDKGMTLQYELNCACKRL